MGHAHHRITVSKYYGAKDGSYAVTNWNGDYIRAKNKTEAQQIAARCRAEFKRHWETCSKTWPK